MIASRDQTKQATKLDRFIWANLEDIGYGYPPDKQARATELVLEQAEVLSRDWAEKV
jgi:hypothetical protein